MQKSVERKILLIEDSEIIQKIHQYYLEELGYRVNIAENGKKALDLFKNNYDLIFLDIGLPDMSGIDVAHHIRQYEKQSAIKRNIIIVLSSDENNAKACHEAGCDAFYTKPVEQNILENILNQWLPIK